MGNGKVLLRQRRGTEESLACRVCTDGILDTPRFYEQRYDARANLADWDYSMNLVEKASVVNLRNFLYWRWVSG